MQLVIRLGFHSSEIKDVDHDALWLALLKESDVARNAIKHLAIATPAATNMGFVGGDSGRQDAAWAGWNSSGKGYKGSGTASMEGTDRDLVPKWDIQEPDGVKLYKALFLGTNGRSLANQLTKDQICSSQGFDLIVGAIRHHFRSYLEAEL